MSMLSLPARARSTTFLTATALLLAGAARPLAAQAETARVDTAHTADASADAAADARRAAIERALRAARWQERSGQGLVLAGTVGGAAAYAAWIRDGGMGMSARQATLFMGATTIAMIGGRRWIAGRGHAARAARAGR